MKDGSPPPMATTNTALIAVVGVQIGQSTKKKEDRGREAGYRLLVTPTRLSLS